MFGASILALNISGFVFYLFGHPVKAYFGTPRSILAHSQYLSSLYSWICIDCKLLVMVPR